MEYSYNFDNTNAKQPIRSNRVRRRLIIGGGIVAGATTLLHVQANAQKSRAPGKTTHSNNRFAGKVVLITGATSGIGEATARAFASEGAIVHFCGRKFYNTLARQINI